MMTILFWNAKNASQSHISSLVADHSVDILILAECKLDRSDIEDEIFSSTGRRFWVDSWMVTPKLYLFTSFNDSHSITHWHDQDRMSVINVLTQGASVNLAMLHFPSKMFNDGDAQREICSPYVQNIRAVERAVGHSRTLVIGDFNMNPYEPGMLGCAAFHAVPWRGLARQGSRKVDETDYQMFYNPMWSFFGDLHLRPPGTYYYPHGARAPFWNVFDQVLVSPDLLDAFDTSSLQVLSMAGSQGLVNQHGLPCVSDHLPIVFRLNEEPIR